MPRKRSLLLYCILLVTAGLCIEALAGSILFFNRQNFIQLVITLTRRPYLLAALQNTIVTPQKFAMLKTAGITLLVINPVITGALLYYRHTILRALTFAVYCCASAGKSIVQVYKNNRKIDNVAVAILLAIVVARSLYYITYFNLQYDEMWSYNYFTSRPFYLSFFTYNNYPLYGLTTQLFKWLPFSMQVNLRLPCVLAGLATCFLLYACIKHYAGNTLVALAGVAIFACMPVTVIYMLFARGVIFELFFAVASAFCALYLLKGNNVKKYVLLYVGANILGLYSMPTHIYFILVQALLMLIYTALYNKKLAVTCVITNLLAVLLGIACYAPVLLGSGLSFVLDAKPYPAFATRNWPGLLLYNNHLNRFLTGFPWGIVIIPAVTIAITCVASQRKRINPLFVIAAVFLFYLPGTVYMVQGLAVPERAMAFAGLAVPLCFCLIFFSLCSSKLKPALYVALLAITVAGSYISHNHIYLHWNEENDKKAVTITNLLLQHNVNICYDSASTSGFNYFYPALEYYYGLHGKTINLNTPAKNSLRSAVFDTNLGYDCVIKNIQSTDTTLKSTYNIAYADTANSFIILLKKQPGR